MKTRLTQLLGIEHPILQGGMAWSSEAELAAAVSNAGGAGIIAMGGRTGEWARAEIIKAKSLTTKPFGVNIQLMAPNVDELVDIICEEKVVFVTLGAGNPVPYFEKFHVAGVKVLPVVPSVKLATRVQEKGADAVIIEGMEAGGHIGTQTTMALMSNVIPYMSIPVIVAGGISDGRAIAAAMLMGASGVQLGSRFMMVTESNVHDQAKNAILNATDTDSVVTGQSRGHGVRGLKSPFTDKFIALERSGAPDEELNALATGTNRRGSVEGDMVNGIVQVGQSLNVLRDIKPTAEVIQTLLADARAALDKAKNIEL